MKTSNIAVPCWTAWANIMPGTKPSLHIRGATFADIYQQPYLEKLDVPFTFRLLFRQLNEPKIHPPLQVLKEVAPYDSTLEGQSEVVRITIPGDDSPVEVPIKVVS